MKERQTLLEACGALYYEVIMLDMTVRVLSSKMTNGSFMNKILLESFLIHLRNLIDFIYLPKCNKDDILAQDFFSNPENWAKLRPTLSANLEEAKKNINKLLSHITYSRLQMRTEQTTWDFMSLRNEIVLIIQAFINNIPKDIVDTRLLDIEHFA